MFIISVQSLCMLDARSFELKVPSLLQAIKTNFPKTSSNRMVLPSLVLSLSLPGELERGTYRSILHTHVHKDTL